MPEDMEWLLLNTFQVLIIRCRNHGIKEVIPDVAMNVDTVSTLAQAGIPNAKGIAVRMKDGAEYRIAISRSHYEN